MDQPDRPYVALVLEDVKRVLPERVQVRSGEQLTRVTL